MIAAELQTHVHAEEAAELAAVVGIEIKLGDSRPPLHEIQAAAKKIALREVVRERPRKLAALRTRYWSLFTA